MPRIAARIQDHFADLTDPRRREVVHPLLNIVTIAICAVMGGADDFVCIAQYGREKKDWLSQFLDLSQRIPSHDCFNRVLAALQPAEFEKCLLSWITALQEVTAGQLVAIDGRPGTRLYSNVCVPCARLRRSFDKASGKSAIPMVSAWATRNCISLGQVVVDQKSNASHGHPQTAGSAGDFRLFGDD